MSHEMSSTCECGVLRYFLSQFYRQRQTRLKPTYEPRVKNTTSELLQWLKAEMFVAEEKCLQREFPMKK